MTSTSNAVPASTESTNNLEAVARAFAQFEWPVFPCQRDKRPYTQHGCHDATTDPDKISRWWREHPDANIGVACGPADLVVLDYDPDKDPTGGARQWLEQLVKGVETRMARTGSGGTHVYWQSRGSHIGNRAGIMPGLDVRGDGGYVIAPPSRNEKGAYSWLNGAPVAPIPEPLIEFLKRPSDQAVVERATDGAIPSGQRNQTLASLAGTFRKRGMAPLAIEAALIAENQEHCNPPLPEDEVRLIARSVSRYEPTASVLVPTGQPSEPTKADTPAHDAVTVSVTLGNGVRAAFAFSEMEKERRELNSHLKLFVPGIEGEPYQQRINLESSSARTELRRELDNLYGKDYLWPRALNSVWSLARETFLSQDRGEDVSTVPLSMDAQDLIEPLLAASGATILFGDGSTSKSYVAHHFAACSTMGRPAMGFYNVPQTNVLYIDFETDVSNFRYRTQRIWDGLGYGEQAPTGLIYWRAKGVPLSDQWEAIARSCQRNNVGWIIVDSAALATSGPPEEAASALQFFAALDRIGLPALVIAHITKSGDQSTHKPYGSAFWANCARRTWYVKRHQDEDSDRMDLGLYCRKVNEGARPHPQGIRVEFEGRTGPVRFSTQDLNAVPELVVETPLKNRLYTLLTTPRSITDLAELTDAGEPSVRKTLTRHSDLFTSIDHLSPGSGRPAKLWARVQREEEPPF